MRLERIETNKDLKNVLKKEIFGMQEWVNADVRRIIILTSGKKWEEPRRPIRISCGFNKEKVYNPSHYAESVQVIVEIEGRLGTFQWRS